jgi:hypothetical protein
LQALATVMRTLPASIRDWGHKRQWCSFQEMDEVMTD